MEPRTSFSMILSFGRVVSPSILVVRFSFGRGFESPSFWRVFPVILIDLRGTGRVVFGGVKGFLAKSR